MLSAALVVYAFDRRRFGIDEPNFLSSIPKEGARDDTKRDLEFQQTIKDLYFKEETKDTFEATDFTGEAEDSKYLIKNAWSLIQNL